MSHVFKVGDRVATTGNDWDAGIVVIKGEVVSVAKKSQLIIRSDDGLTFPVKARLCWKLIKQDAA